MAAGHAALGRLLPNARGAAAQFLYTSYENTSLASRLKYDTRACNRLRYRGLVSSLQSASHKIYSVPHPRGSPSSLERHCGGRGGWGRLSALNCPQSSAWSSVCRRGVLPPANLTLSQETFPRLAQKTPPCGWPSSLVYTFRRRRCSSPDLHRRRVLEEAAAAASCC